MLARRSCCPRGSAPIGSAAAALGPLLTLMVMLVLGLGLGGCAGGLPIDSRYTAAGQDSRVQFVVLHYTAGPMPGALKTLTQTAVSSHYLLTAEPPAIYRLVDENRRAWHAGVGSWEGLRGLNASSIGIEIVNAGHDDDPAGAYEPYPSAQIDLLIALLRDIVQRHHVAPHHILGHSDIAPSRKQDPGPMFPWPRLVEAGLVPWPDPDFVATQLALFRSQPLPEAAWFQGRLVELGYGLPVSGIFDRATHDALAAFQMKYRPTRYDGQPDAETAALLQVVTMPGGLYLVGVDGQRRPYRN